MAKVIDEKTGDVKLVPVFRKGSLNLKGEPEFDADEMMIYYIDLYGNQVKYASRGAAGALRPYIRMRWSNPDAHVYNSRPTKYQTPKGAGLSSISRSAFRMLLIMGSRSRR